VIDQKILAEKIKAAQERLAYLESLREPAPGVAELVAEVKAELPKRGPGRPRKAA
jgi:hypothetical protein